MNDELREKLSNLRVTVWKQTNLNGQANLDHDSVEEILDFFQADRQELIARVEREVIGEDEQTDFGSVVENIKHDKASRLIRNGHRAKLRAVLTQLKGEKDS